FILRNLKDHNAYLYGIESLGKREALLKLLSFEITNLINTPKGHLIWAIIEPKNIEKTLPILNEINIAKITFFYAHYSQKNFKLSEQRLQRIIQKSSEQCGRTTFLEIEFLKDLQEALIKYPDSVVLDFGGKPILDKEYHSILVGPEGGFSQQEKHLLKNKFIYSPSHCNILRSENAAIYALCKII
ncbi:MAG: RsmE family RNA methyltransferase, partial [Helicobacter sp.]|nr:RsmE family RNA methyltransferase [Helicobacter sp.]